MATGFRFSKYIPPLKKSKTPFEALLDIFKQLLLITSGDVAETLEWMNDLDRQYKITTPEYGMGDFIEDLKEKGYIKQEDPNNPAYTPTAKTERALRKGALDELFGKMKKAGPGDHQTRFAGKGDEVNPDLRSFQFGDSLEQLDMEASFRNAFINHGIDSFRITEEDLIVRETDYKTQTATVLMIDISHSMILYGEDRITPAKKVALALSEYITTRFPKDTLDIIVFGNDAWQVEIKDLPYLSVGPYHTNTVAGLELATDILRRRKVANKQIMMITDGKPTCLKEGDGYYRNTFGLDAKILNKTFNIGAQLKRLKIPVTTFMIASDPYLQQFVRQFTEINGGKAYFSGVNGLGNFVLEDFARNRKKGV